ncbi:MAG: hypothetical protein ABFD54_07035 [Armatimonadota bacterium]
MGGKPSALRRGAVVTVKSIGEIQSTLDQGGMLDGIPFQAEMRNYCGKKLKVLKAVDRLYVEGDGLAAIGNIALLEGARCDGKAHSECKRRCMLLFKTQWLRMEEDCNPASEDTEEPADAEIESSLAPCIGQRCVLQRAVKPLRYRHLRQYTRGINWPMFVFLSNRNSRWYLRKMVDSLFRRVHAPSRPVDAPKPEAPSLAPGDIVEVRSKEEILATLNRKARCRGLAFVGSMVRYCEGRYRVLDRVSRLIDERSNTMREVSDGVILEDVTCTGEAYGGCPRQCYWLWRECWLKKVDS